MVEFITKAADGVSDVVRIATLLLIGGVMIGVGVTLAKAGRYEAAIPLLIGTLAIFKLPKLMIDLYRDVTGNY